MINVNLNVLQTCSSTNDIAFKEAKNGAIEGSSYLSYMQTKGRGRNENKWQSTKGNLFLSTVLRPSKKKIFWHQFSLIVGFSVLEVLCDLGVKKKLIELKWPNDILVDKCKISGILLESSSDFIVAGIGVNISKVPSNETKWKTTKLYDHINITFLIEDIALKILKKIMKNYELWNVHDFNNLLIKINPFIRNINKEIILSLLNKNDIISGVFLGIGENGGLKINKNGNIIEYFSIDNFIFPKGKS